MAHFVETFRLEPPDALAAAALAAYEAGFVQRLEVLGNRLPRNVGAGSEFRCREGSSTAQLPDDTEARLVPQRREDRRHPHVRAARRYLSTTPSINCQPSSLASKASARRAIGIASKPDSTTVSSVSSPDGSSENVTSVIGSLE